MTVAWWMVTRLILWFYTQSLKWTNYTHIKTVTHVSPLWYLGIMSRRKGKTSLTRQILKIKVMRKSRLHWINIRQHSVHGSRKRTTDHFKVTSSRQKVREAVDGFPTDPRHETDETESSVTKMREADVDARIFTGVEKSPRSPATTGKGQKHPAPESNRRSSAAVHQKCKNKQYEMCLFNSNKVTIAWTHIPATSPNLFLNILESLKQSFYKM